MYRPNTIAYDLEDAFVGTSIGAGALVVTLDAKVLSETEARFGGVLP